MVATEISRGGKLSYALKRLIPNLLPKDGRRAVFLTTLFMEVAKVSTAHKELVEELNHRFKLVNCDSALKFPMSLKDTVWEGRHPRLRDRDANVAINDEELDAMARRIISECPEWSRYGDYQKVLEETKEVIKTSLLHHDIGPSV